MIPTDFDYARPASVSEALSLLSRAGAMPLAGGQSLVPLLADRSVTADLLVDISRLAELRRVSLTREHLLVGAAASLGSLMTPELATALPLLAAALLSVGSAAIRSRGTLVGNLVRASPNSELPVAVMALGASLVMRNLKGERVLGAQDFFLGPHRTALEAGELVTELRIPLSAAGRTTAAFAEIAAPAGAPPLCCVAVHLQTDASSLVGEARIVAGGVTGIPARCPEHEACIVGHPLHEAPARLANVLTSLQPSPELPEAAYALDVLPVLIRRAVSRAMAQFAGPSA
jgi:carbon-monoxide dehydrogenase medium subunit